MTPTSRFLIVLATVALVLPTSLSLAQQRSPSIAQETRRQFIPQIPPGGRRILGAPAPLPDLVIVSATPSGDCTGTYAYINVTVKIQNIGKGTAVMPEPLLWAPWVALWDWTGVGIKWIASGAPAQLLSKQTATFSMTVPTTRMPGGDFSIGVQVDPWDKILESNEANNVTVVHCK
jgi:hypothetical protein